MVRRIRELTRHSQITAVFVLVLLVLPALSPIAQAAPPGLPPRPTVPAPPAPPPSSGGASGSSSDGRALFAELYVNFDETWADLSLDWHDIWTVVQWQDNAGVWHAVQGWQGTLDGVRGLRAWKRWWIPEHLVGRGPFRWLVYTSVSGRQIAATGSFYLPHQSSVAVGVSNVLPDSESEPKRTPTRTPAPTSTPTPTLTPTPTPTSNVTGTLTITGTILTPTPDVPWVGEPAFDPECGTSIKYARRQTMRAEVAYGNVTERMIVGCIWYGVDRDGYRHYQNGISYNYFSSIAWPGSGEAMAYCSTAGRDWDYPIIELDIALFPVTVERVPANAVTVSTCRYKVVR